LEIEIETKRQITKKRKKRKRREREERRQEINICCGYQMIENPD